MACRHARVVQRSLVHAWAFSTLLARATELLTTFLSGFVLILRLSWTGDVLDTFDTAGCTIQFEDTLERPGFSIAKENVVVTTFLAQSAGARDAWVSELQVCVAANHTTLRPHALLHVTWVPRDVVFGVVCRTQRSKPNLHKRRLKRRNRRRQSPGAERPQICLPPLLPWGKGLWNLPVSR